jgi:hypothetical protein
MAGPKPSAAQDLLQDLQDIGEDFSRYPAHLKPDERPPPRACPPFSLSEQDIITKLKSYVDNQGDLTTTLAALTKPIADIFTSGDGRKATDLQYNLYGTILRYSRTISQSDAEAQNRLVDLGAGLKSRPEPPPSEIQSPAFIEKLSRNYRSPLVGISGILECV